MTLAPKKKVALFDIDGTIFRSSLIIEVFNALVARGVYPRTARVPVERAYLQWLNRKGHYNDYLYCLVDEFYKYLPNKRTLRIDAEIARVVAWQRDRVYRYTRDLVQEYKKKGYHMVAISGSPHAVVEPFALAMGFQGAIGRTLEVRNGRYTGRILYQNGIAPTIAHYDKPALLADYATEHGFTIDYRNSLAVGDSEGDIEMLSIVGHPIAFNPSMLLARHARAHGWSIVVERKDVIYEIAKATLINRDVPQRVRTPKPRATR